jgi:hypothetical protein
LAGKTAQESDFSRRRSSARQQTPQLGQDGVGVLGIQEADPEQALAQLG